HTDRAPHSLPTRRSSDLRNAGRAGRALTAGAVGIRQDAAHHRRATVWHQHFSLHALSVDAGNATYGDAGVDGVVFNRDAQHDCADRKSTRLNSSHVKISY